MGTEKFMAFKADGTAYRLKGRILRHLDNEPVTDADKSNIRDTLGITGTNGDLLAANNLDDVASTSTAMENLKIPSIGLQPNQVPLSGMLNSGAWLDFDAFYEEKTWIPVISFGGGTTGILYSAQEGLCIKIGKQVTAHGSITLADKGTSNGSMRIAGLPYTSRTTTGSYQSAVIGLSAGWDASVTETPALVVQSASTQLLGTVALSGSELQDTHFGNTTTIRFSATYQIA